MMVVYAATALFIIGFNLVVSPIDTFGRIFSLVVAAILSLRAFQNYKAMITVGAQAPAFPKPSFASTAHHIRFLNNNFLVLTIALAVITAFTIYDLNSLESGASSSVLIWLPLSLLYQTCGYWVTILIIPALWLVLGMLYLQKLRKLKIEEKEKSGI